MNFWECTICGGKYKTEDEDDYGSTSGDKRECLLCGGIGNVMYHGRPAGSMPYIQSDSLGLRGVRSQVDGKYYDSKSAYYKSLKATGHIIHESGLIPQKRETRGDFDCTKELKEAWQIVKSKQPKKKGRK